MTSSSQITGLISGLDTTSIISALMAVEQQPQKQLEDKKTSLTTLVTALTALNTKTQSLGSAAQTAATASSWGALTATSSSDGVTATADSTATATSLSFTVDQLAQSQISVTNSLSSVSDLTGGKSTMSLKVGSTVTEIDVSKASSLADVASDINSSGAGVTASVVSIKGSDGTTTQRLQLTGQNTGAANAFTLYQGSKDDVSAGTATAVTTTNTRTAQNAQLTLWSGTPMAQTVTSSSNTFSDVLTGVDINVTATSTSPVTLTVARDTTALTKLGSDLVSQLNQVLSEISSQTASTTSTDSDGNTVITGGTLSGESSVRSLQENLTDAGSDDVNGVSPSSIGITYNEDGTFAFDSGAFASALASDPDKVQSILTSIAKRVQTVTDSASDKYDGTITQSIASDNSEISDLATKISDWDTTLADRKTALETQWADLETALSKLKAQSTSLDALLGTSSSSSSSTSSTSSSSSS